MTTPYATSMRGRASTGGLAHRRRKTTSSSTSTELFTRGRYPIHRIHSKSLPRTSNIPKKNPTNQAEGRPHHQPPHHYHNGTTPPERSYHRILPLPRRLPDQPTATQAPNNRTLQRRRTPIRGPIHPPRMPPISYNLRVQGSRN